jgi:hypothetical protein
MVAMPTAFPVASRSTPFQEGGGEEWRKGVRKSTRRRKQARATGRDQESIERHYTQVDFDDDSSAKLVESLYSDKQPMEAVC